jgi:hypothetical protein
LDILKQWETQLMIGAMKLKMTQEFQADQFRGLGAEF